MATQLEGTVTLGGTDVSTEVFAFTITEERSTSTRRPTFGSANESERAGAAKAMVTIDFEDTLDPSASLAHQEIADAIRTDSGELAFEVTYKTGAVSASNPKYSGTIVCTSLETGGEVGSELEQSQTFPVTAAGITIATT